MSVEVSSLESFEKSIASTVNRLVEDLYNDDRNTDWRKGRQGLENRQEGQHNPALDTIVDVALEQGENDGTEDGSVRLVEYAIVVLANTKLRAKGQADSTMDEEKWKQVLYRLDFAEKLALQLLSVKLLRRLKGQSTKSGDSLPPSVSGMGKSAVDVLKQ